MNSGDSDEQARNTADAVARRIYGKVAADVRIAEYQLYWAARAELLALNRSERFASLYHCMSIPEAGSETRNTISIFPFLPNLVDTA